MEGVRPGRWETAAWLIRMASPRMGVSLWDGITRSEQKLMADGSAECSRSTENGTGSPGEAGASWRHGKCVS